MTWCRHLSHWLAHKIDKWTQISEWPEMRHATPANGWPALQKCGVGARWPICRPHLRLVVELSCKLLPNLSESSELCKTWDEMMRWWDLGRACLTHDDKCILAYLANREALAKEKQDYLMKQMKHKVNNEQTQKMHQTNTAKTKQNITITSISRIKNKLSSVQARAAALDLDVTRNWWGESPAGSDIHSPSSTGNLPEAWLQHQDTSAKQLKISTKSRVSRR